MITLNLQLFGGNGSSSGIGGGGQNFAALSKAVITAEKNNDYIAFQKALKDLPVGTKVYDGSKTMNGSFILKDTYYEVTHKYSDGTTFFTLWGDEKDYTEHRSSYVASEMWKKTGHPKFKLKVTK